MSIKCPENEQVKSRFFYFLEHADGKSESSIKQFVMSITRFEAYTRHANFKTFDQKQAVGFKQHMQSGDLSAATTLSTVKQVMRFLRWLSMQNGYKTRVRSDAIDYMNMSEKAVRAAAAPREREFPTLPMIEAVIEQMPFRTAIEKRNRAMIALSAMTAIRITALTSLKLKHFDRRRRLIIQQPDEVATKNSKRIDTFLIPVVEHFEGIFLDWIDHLENVELFGPSDPIFPQTLMGQNGQRRLTSIGLKRAHWGQAASARKIVNDAFEAAGLPRYGPHSFRNMLVSEMYRRGLSIAAFKAGSQNLGHEHVLTTLTAYGKVPLEEQGRLIRGAFVPFGADAPITLAAIEALLRDRSAEGNSALNSNNRKQNMCPDVAIVAPTCRDESVVE